MFGNKKHKQFEQLMLPHLDAAHNLARWLVHDPQEAEDVVQSAFMRAYESFGRYRPGNHRAWLMTIVRNQAYTLLRKRTQTSNLVNFDEALHSHQGDGETPFPAFLMNNPEQLAANHHELEILQDTLQQLPVEFREVVLLRELYGFSYQEIADITDAPQGTVMSRLSRARHRLLELLAKPQKSGQAREL